MGATATLSPAEYLATHFPDREPEYVHGELKERPLPDRYHARLQAIIAAILTRAASEKGYEALAEVRCQLAPELFRLPDVALFQKEPFENVPTRPPVVVVEVVSKNEPYTDLFQKLDDYLVWRVKNIWVIEPRRGKLSVFSKQGLVDVDALKLDEFGLSITIADLADGLPPR